MIRSYNLVRDVDISGVSGTGLVAEAVVFSNGRTAVSWLGAVRSVTVYESLADAVAIHGHDGNTAFIPTTPY